MTIYLYLGAGTLLAACGQLLLKVGATGRVSLEAFLNGWTAAGLGCYALSTILWIYALSKAPLTLVYPFTALTFVFVYFSGIAFLGETTSIKAMLGITLILVGLYLVTSSVQ